MRQSGVRLECTRSRDAAPTMLRSASRLLTTCLRTRKHQPRFLRHHEVAAYWTCCGNCSFQVQEVRLDYFPDENASAYCRSKGITMIGDKFFELSCKPIDQRVFYQDCKTCGHRQPGVFEWPNFGRTLELPFSNYECLHSGSTSSLI